MPDLSIGFRCNKTSLAYVAIEFQTEIIVEQDFVEMPSATRGEQLGWLRREVQEIIARLQPKSMSMKVPEGRARVPRGRIEAEAVVLEASATSAGMCVTRTKQQLKSDIGFPQAARYINRALQGTPLEDLPRAKYEEAALAALAGARRDA